MKTKTGNGMSYTKAAAGIIVTVLLLGGGVWAAKNTETFQPKTDDSANRQAQQSAPLPTRDPFRDMIALQRQMEQLFGSTLSPYSGFPAFDAILLDQDIEQAMDLRENADSYIVQMDLPGLEKSDIKVEVEDQVLSVSGERKTITEQKDDEKVLVQERSLSSFGREVVLPCDVDAANVTASYHAGVLTITLPKTEQQKESHVIAIQ